MSDLFRKFAHKFSAAAGSPIAFAISTLTILVWACLGPMFNYSDTWQLVINTGTTIVTFLMVLLIQNTQNREDLCRLNKDTEERIEEVQEMRSKKKRHR